jgi:hypothetical protein
MWCLRKCVDTVIANQGYAEGCQCVWAMSVLVHGLWRACVVASSGVLGPGVGVLTSVGFVGGQYYTVVDLCKQCHNPGNGCVPCGGV